MTAEPNRQPEGIPTGGQFATKIKSDDVPALAVQDDGALRAVLNTRDAIRERRLAVYEEMQELNHVTAVYSAQALAAQLLSKHPDAATLTLSENLDGNGWYEVRQLRTADGTVLEDTEDDDAWTYAEAPNGTYVEELANDLSFDNDRWASGIATVHDGTKYDYKTVEIDLKAALVAKLPPVPPQAD
jgi:hypothetical protein